MFAGKSTKHRAFPLGTRWAQAVTNFRPTCFKIFSDACDGYHLSNSILRHVALCRRLFLGARGFRRAEKPRLEPPGAGGRVAGPSAAGGLSPGVLRNQVTPSMGCGCEPFKMLKPNGCGSKRLRAGPWVLDLSTYCGFICLARIFGPRQNGQDTPKPPRHNNQAPNRGWGTMPARTLLFSTPFLFWTIILKVLRWVPSQKPCAHPTKKCSENLAN